MTSPVVPPSDYARPPIVHTYYRHRPPSVPAIAELVPNTSILCPIQPISSSTNPPSSDDHLIALQKEGLGSPGWRAAMTEKLNALLGNGTWVLVDLLAGKRASGCKWVFTS
ncbi:uncharacterized protein LOC130997241 [Salvia miltiorrhiza]|uniref:uncharacterized protein LOC130997241 n=1 Tax=Salvia miltiorrhiza TaxID=226208 RepID=UPI0025AC31F7|nr:uncharacterized protein LOC130997241 [Salvia miltiorrhiza]